MKHLSITFISLLIVSFFYPNRIGNVPDSVSRNVRGKMQNVIHFDMQNLQIEANGLLIEETNADSTAYDTSVIKSTQKVALPHPKPIKEKGFKKVQNVVNNIYTPVLGDTSGYSAGNFSVSDGGGANYSIPITVTPGTAGMEPKLSLTYSSQGGNELLGAGWSLQGLSCISRSTKTIAQDTVSKGISLTSSDTYSLDGERLIPIVGANGANGTEYRTEQNAFSRVISYLNQNGSPQYFKAWTKEGLIIEYGNTQYSRIEAADSVNPNNVLFWMVNRISDTKGNYIHFDYFEDNATGEYYPTQITYTGNTVLNRTPYASVLFTYSSKPDEKVRNIAGAKLYSKKRITSISSSYQTSIFKTYNFSYQTSPSTGISLLTSITECGADGKCFNPTTFHYKPENTFNISRYSGGTKIPTTDITTANSSIYSGDWDGDGLSDLMLANYNSGWNKFFSNTSQDSTLNFSTTLTNLIPQASISSGGVSPLDWNGDGFTDILWINAVSNTYKFFINNKPSSFSGLNFSQQTTGIDFSGFPSNGQTQLKVGDFDGNSQPDIFLYDKNTGNTRLFLNKTTGTGQTLTFSAAINTIVPTVGIINGTSLYVSDFTSDGLVDLMWYNQSDGNNVWFINEGLNAQGNLSFTQPPNYFAVIQGLNGGKKIDFGDWNADGITDLMWYNDATGETKWWYNKGKPQMGTNNFKQETSANLNASLVTGTGIDLIISDFNADGLSDIVRYNKSNGTNHWLVAKERCNFSTSLNPSFPATPGFSNPIPVDSISGGEGIFFSAFNTKTLSDIVWQNNSTGVSRWYKSNLSNANVIDTIQNGNGTKIIIEYSTLLNDSIYTKDRDAVFPMYDMQGRFFVVSKITTQAGTIGGGTNSVKYFYKGAKMHTQGRGFRGFHELRTKDLTTGITDRKVFNRDYKYLSSPVDTVETIMPDGQVIARTINQSGLKTFSSQTMPWLTIHFSFTQKSTSYGWDLNGNLISQQDIRQSYDNYGNPTSVIVKQGNGVIDSTYNVYINNVTSGNWLLGRLTESTVTKTEPGKPTISRKTAFTYDAVSGLRTQDILDANLATNQQVVKNYTFDANGNITQTTETAYNGTQMETRTSSMTYDALGRFALSNTNTLGQTTTKTYHPVLGLPLTITDPNSRTVTYLYDGFGRNIKETMPDGNWSASDFRLCGGGTNPPNTPAHAVTYIYQQSSNAPPTISWYDIAGRAIRNQAISFNGTAVLTDMEYNLKGQVSRSSKPYFAGTSPTQWVYKYYDQAGRDTLTVLPGNRQFKTQYNGLEKIATNPLNQTKRVVNDLGGRILAVYDNQNNALTYQYDVAGKTIAVIDPLGNIISNEYDYFGNLTHTIDPDRGAETHTYNRWGQILQTTDAKNEVVKFKYDLAGRMIQQIQPEDTTTWIYDTAPNGIGQLASVSSTNGHSASFTYDIYGRTLSKTEIIKDSSYTYTYAYQSDGRLATTQYPTGFRVRNEYNSLGFLSEVRNDISNQLYWRADSYNAKGQLLQKTVGNGAVTQISYDDNEDWIKNISTTAGANTLQNLVFHFNAIGNLTSRKDSSRNLDEIFTYDNLNRLTKTAITGGAEVNIKYDVLGNILSKSDAGTFAYGGNGAGPHQLTSIQKVNNALCIPSLQAQYLYTSFDKVKQITLDTARLTLEYGYDNQRIVQQLYLNDSLSEIKYYIGGLLEKKIKNGVTQYIHFISGGDGIVGVYNTLSTGGSNIQYWHKDHLGSLQSVSDTNGNLIEELSYDAWGKRRNADWTPIVGLLATTSDRGFTGHEHLDIFSLINMNGRVYDPILGRFIQADPFIQDYTDIQSLNRYAYVLNNPLSLTDPSGYFWKKLFRAVAAVATFGISEIKGVQNFVKENWKTIVVVAVAIAISVVTAGAGAAIIGATTFWSGVLGAAITGAAVGFSTTVAGTLLNGGSFSNAMKGGLKAAAIGAVSGALTFGVGAQFGHATTVSNVIPKAICHGLIQGATAELQGGKFESGFMSGAFSSAGGLGTKYIDNAALHITASAIVGGTASCIGGGKFSNGAISGAMVAALNELSAGQQDAKKAQEKTVAQKVVKSVNTACKVTSAFRSGAGLACAFSGGGAGVGAGFCATVGAVNLGCNLIDITDAMINPSSDPTLLDGFVLGKNIATTTVDVSLKIFGIQAAPVYDVINSSFDKIMSFKDTIDGLNEIRKCVDK
jgi:RHS repeat-associated protein